MDQIASRSPRRADTAGSEPIRVLIVIAGGLRDPGGVTRCMEYLIDSWSRLPDRPEHRVVDSRGAGGILLSPLYFLRALLVVGGEALRRRRMIVHANMCEYGSTLRKLPIVCLARALGAPAVIHLHGAEMKAMFDRMPAWRRRLFRLGVSQANRIVVLGANWEEFLCRDVGISRERVIRISNAVPVPAVTGTGRTDGRCRLLFLGRLEERKGADRFLEALASPELADLEYEAVMTGDGRVELYRDMAGTLGLAGRVRFTGWLDRPAVGRLMQGSDVLVLPSLNEGLPMAILEGMAHGLAVVTTPVGAISDVVRDGQTGLLVPPGNAPALASALRRVITDAELRLRLGAAARAPALEEFDVADYGARFTRLYGELLAGR